jgi:MinD-like ATPase involved in chromosome partitioning or flagellar assembly
VLVAVCSLKGAPGVTTFALALASCWPETSDPVVLEADPSGGDVAVRYDLPLAPGLMSLAAEARQTVPAQHEGDAELLWRHSGELPGDLVAIVAPPDADRAHAALAALTAEPGLSAVTGAARDPSTVVVADCGRVDERSVTMPLVRAADVVLLLTGAERDALSHLPRRLRVVRGWNRAVELVLVGEGYAADVVAEHLGVAPIGHLPHDPRTAALMCGRPLAGRRAARTMARSRLVRAAAEIAAALDESVEPVESAVAQHLLAWTARGIVPAPDSSTTSRKRPGGKPQSGVSWLSSDRRRTS